MPTAVYLENLPPSTVNRTNGVYEDPATGPFAPEARSFAHWNSLDSHDMEPVLVFDVKAKISNSNSNITAAGSTLL